MKKLMTMMLGLSLVLGGSALFAQDQPKTEKTEQKSKKKVSKKKHTSKAEQPKAQ